MVGRYLAKKRRKGGQVEASIALKVSGPEEVQDQTRADEIPLEGRQRRIHVRNWRPRPAHLKDKPRRDQGFQDSR